MICPICGKRPAKRYCPAGGEKICAVCCGREREVSIDCPLDCAYLAAAHRYEREHPKPAAEAEFPYKDIQFSPDFVYQHWPLVAGIGTAILTFYSRHKTLRDSEIFVAIERLAETYRTLGTGIYYERPPDAALPAALYAEIQRFLQEFRNAEAARAGLSSLRDSDIFQLLVFLLRMNRTESNGRPRSRAFLEFLRARLPVSAETAGAAAGASAEAPRIIIP